MSGRTFRVFVSSTFSDLKAERNALSRYVYPRLRALCEARGFKFQAVDLRWGVRDEAAVDQQTMRICLDEIARCQELSPKPNFIVLLGDRYGWCPLPSVIPVKEMDLLRPQLEVAGCWALVEQWYLRDDNAVPAEYVLQRQDAFKKDDVWGPTERRLHEALANAAERAGLGTVERRKYCASAVELEILKGALEPKDAKEHVFGFFREITNLDDVKAALIGDDADKAGVLIDTLPSGRWDGLAWRRQRDLRQTLRDRVGKENIWPYDTRWNEGALDLTHAVADLPASATPPLEKTALIPDTPSLSAAWKEHSAVIAAAANTPLQATTNLCEAVWQRLSRVIVLQMDALDREQSDSLEVEKQAHADFAEKRARVFRGRKVPLERIAAYLNAGAARPLVVCGESGSGKSALLARAIELARIAHPDAVIVTRFIGAAPGASEARPLMQSVCRELTRALGGDEKTVPDAYDKLVNDFPERLKLARPERPVFLFIDALDQLSDSNDGRKLRWLPQALPPHVRVVVSTLPEPEYHCFPALRDRSLPSELMQDLIQVSAMSAGEGKEVLQAWLAELPKPRKLTGEQAALVLTTFEPKGLPLYLKLAFEEARRWHSYDGVPKDGLAPDVPSIIRAMFGRLEDQHGEAVVSRAFGFLAATRHGLSDDEMLALLWSDEEVRKDFHDRKHHELPEGEAALPPVVWSRLYFDIDPYLAHRDVLGVGLLAFYHRQLAEVATEVYLVTEGREAGVHGQLADYFAGRWEGADKHALIELVEQLLEASRGEQGRLEEAENVCRNARFLRLRCEVLGPYAVEQELVATATWLEEHEGDSTASKQGVAALRQIASATGQEAHWLALMGEAGLPICFDDIVYNRLLCNGVAEAEIAGALKSLELRLPLLRPVRMSEAEHVLEGHTGVVFACALSADGKLALSGSYDKTLRVWDTTTGVTLKVLEGHTGLVRACALSTDGKLALSGSRDNTLRVWNTAAGVTLKVLEGHTLEVSGCALSADGKLALSGSRDSTLRIWDTATGVTLKVLEGHTDEINACALSADGTRALSGSRDGSLRVWDTLTGDTLKVLEEHTGLVLACALSASGEYAVSGSDNKKLRVWDTATGHTAKIFDRSLKALEGHTNWVSACAVTADCTRTLSGSWDGTLRIWYTTTGDTLKVLEGHTGPVTACALSADGKRALSGSDDKTLRVWDTTKQTLHVLEGHTKAVDACALSADGLLALSGSRDETLRLWDTRSGQTLLQLQRHTGRVLACALSADGKHALSGSDDNTLSVWDTTRGTSRPRFEARKVLKGHTYWVNACALSADGKCALSGSGDETLRVWDTTTGETVNVLEGHTNWVRACALSADGKRALSGSDDKTLRVWDTVTGAMLKILEGHTGGITACALSADGKRALSGSDDKTLRFWNATTGGTLLVLEGHTMSVNACALSADGKRALSGSRDNTLRVWDLDRGTCIQVVPGVDSFRCVALSDTLVAAGDDAHNLWMLAWPFGSLVPN